MRILLVEDNRDIAASVSEYLEMKGMVCDFAYDGLTGLNQAVLHEYDLYILDVSMPGISGLQLCRTLREDKQDTRPIIFLTARDTLQDKLAGFDSGADDYLVKPFELQELYVRIQAIAKRYQGQNKRMLTLGDLAVNIDTEEVVRDNSVISLTPNNYKMLLLLIKNSPNVVTRQQLEYELWGDASPDSDSLRSHIYKLRQKIDKPFAVQLIHTVQGRGLRMAIV
ncbi:MAG: response regulator transcription factor [Oleispira antarctica]|uniref:Two component transcriptional regulator, winged helix family n=1 Tax=Oleispira antarctica RB-8 TaxID=698738 RepID=R4YR83_OLEAN|nr:response regulator transcription factor [Oleispira antarctica]MBQ0793660.1 response regulator transcription factor [Oleispira antarctica]CCK77582.1 Two component transcriptional regulator, winged helix family precursor [Oleispira antarctica RB-8]|tara:strand:+ start:117 stop:788 length:672 start_codon:yes stop_codon:yes gene_type:complete